ncbi:cytochrome b/b6 domain-containing protein [Desulfosporosinus meridiei]|uniref:Ni,Fe-hydrogenase I cytochrome b subunit n=1 Tax=Desulfosporosinus meridiei (strain ATCC BAA-275 / DSM 13257 / KCTC 12902 / NCIMB 13706 / S10) TaxID=768704 RepID=J7IQC4_DESMD|nr:cytochrome b/b6 domain-containing protein [Desulfosporosinus meridiei]AFQ42364.1 Ni,Fe-hydrogenase I cytochrome b subunit [Desulfosporosinus meridiei DSM 13257]
MKHSVKLRKPLLKQLKADNLKGRIIKSQSIWVRIFHWGFAISLVVIISTGLQLHKPAHFLALNFSKVLVAHIVFSWFALSFLALRFTDALIRKDDSLIPKIRDLKHFPKLMAYYFFLRSSPPPARKYNSGQLVIYFSWFLVFLLASFLGLASYWQGEHLIWVWHLVGGFQMIRWIKFIISIYFLATIPVHIYLSLTEDISRLQAMVTGYERKPPMKNESKNFPRIK